MFLKKQRDKGMCHRNHSEPLEQVLQMSQIKVRIRVYPETLGKQVLTKAITAAPHRIAVFASCILLIQHNFIRGGGTKSMFVFLLNG